MKIHTKLTLWSTSTIIMFGIFIFVSWNSVNRLIKAWKAVDHTNFMIQSALEIEASLNLVEHSKREYLLCKKTQHFESYKNASLLIDRKLSLLLTTVRTDSQKAILEKIKDNFSLWRKLADKRLENAKTFPSSNRHTGVDDLDKLQQELEKIKLELRKFSLNEHRLMSLRRDHEVNTLNDIFLIFAIASVLILLIYSLLGYFVASSITHPISNVVDSMKDIAKGDADLTKKLYTSSKSEVREFVNGFNLFVDKLHRIIVKIKSNNELIDTTAEGLSATATEFADNTVKTISSSDVLLKTAADIRQIMEYYSEAVVNVLSKTTDKLGTFKKQLDEVLATEYSTLKSGDRKEVTIKDNIIELHNQIDGIEHLIFTIRDIAAQSTILSVNTSIQATKAGEYGKGFNIVAQEIKELAVKSKNVVDSSVILLNKIQENTNKTMFSIEKHRNIVDSILESNKKIQAISEQIEYIENLSLEMDKLNDSKQDFITSMMTLIQEVNVFKNSAEPNLAGAKKLEEAGINLENLSGTLKELTDDFKV